MFQTSVGEVGDVSPQSDQPAVPLQQIVMRILFAFIPIQSRPFECFRGLRIGHVFDMGAEGGEFAPPPVSHGAAQRRVFMIGKIKKRRASSPFLTLKKHRNEWRGHDQRRGDFQASNTHQMTAALALGTVADLIVILQIPQKRMSRQSREGPAVRSLSK